MHPPQDLIFPGFFQGLGSAELLIILFVILLLFGAKKLPELARGMGKSLREFKKATTEIEDDFRAAMDEKDSPEPMAPAKIEPIAGGNANPPEEKEETRA